MHQCFRKGCTIMVPDYLLACKEDWNRLSLATQRAVHRTKGLHLFHSERRAAFRAVRADWGDELAATESDPIP